MFLLFNSFASAAYLFAHTGSNISLTTSGAWENVTFDEESSLKDKINHNHNDATNDTFTITESGVYDIAFHLTFSDSAPTPTSHVEIRVIKNGAELGGSLLEEDSSRQYNDFTIGNGGLFELVANDEIKFQFTSDDTTVSMSSHATYGEHKDTAAIKIIKLDAITGFPTAANYTFKRFQCDLSTTGRGIGFFGLFLGVILIWSFSFYIKIPIFSILIGFVVCYFAWTIAACFQFANIMFIIMGMVSIMHGIYYSVKKPVG